MPTRRSTKRSPLRRNLQRSIAVALVLGGCGEGLVMRNLPRVRTTCRLGIDQNTDKVSLETCADARNVWAPDGRVVQRPGYVGIASIIGNTSKWPDAGAVHAYEDVDGSLEVKAYNVSLDLNSLVGRQPLVDGDRWYVGISSVVDTTSSYALAGVYTTVTLGSSTRVRVKPEYWNGLSWQYLRVLEATSSGVGANPTVLDSVATPGHLEVANGDIIRWYFVPPGDWAQSDLTDSVTATTYTRHWLRFQLLEGPADVALDATVQLVNTFRIGNVTSGALKVDIALMDVVQFQNSKRYISAITKGSGTFYVNSDAPGLSSGYRTLVDQLGDPTPGSLAVVPGGNEAFATVGGQVTVHTPLGYAEAPPIFARVEDRDLYVGSGAPYDKDVIVQLGAFPKARYVLYHQGRLWAAGGEGEPFTVRWTGKTPYHKVWPGLSWENIEEDDNSEISALFAHGDHTAVAKNDSIWIMRDKGLNPLDLREYDAEAIVRGIGVVANASAKGIRGRTIFLAEDGVYAFDGTPQAEKLSDRIQGYVNRITPGRAQYATAAHWRSRGMYLLSVPLDGSNANSHVLAWDYVGNSWWVWDIGVQHWLEDEGSDNQERLLFSTRNGHIYELGKGRTDNGTAIDAWYETHELADSDFNTKRARCVCLAGSNNQGNTTVELRPMGSAHRSVTATVDFSDYNETNRILAKRFRRPRFKSVAEFFTVKIRNNAKTDVLEMSHLDLEYQNLGER